jgi:hypothetical protein
MLWSPFSAIVVKFFGEKIGVYLKANVMIQSLQKVAGV